MAILMTVSELMSHIEDGDSKWVTLVTACSGYEVYSNWYFNCPYEMKVHYKKVKYDFCNRMCR